MLQFARWFVAYYTARKKPVGKSKRGRGSHGNRNALGYVGRRRCVVQLVAGFLIFCGPNLAAGRGGWQPQPQPQFHLLWRRSRNLLINALIDSLTVCQCACACVCVCVHGPACIDCGQIRGCSVNRNTRRSHNNFGRGKWIHRSPASSINGDLNPLSSALCAVIVVAFVVGVAVALIIKLAY